MRYHEIVKKPIIEQCSAGATGAGAIAGVVGGLGAGDPKASIYYSASKKRKKNKKPAIIRR